MGNSLIALTVLLSGIAGIGNPSKLQCARLRIECHEETQPAGVDFPSCISEKSKKVLIVYWPVVESQQFKHCVVSGDENNAISSNVYWNRNLTGLDQSA